MFPCMWFSGRPGSVEESTMAPGSGWRGEEGGAGLALAA